VIANGFTVFFYSEKLNALPNAIKATIELFLGEVRGWWLFFGKCAPGVVIVDFLRGACISAPAESRVFRIRKERRYPL